jgi:uncharacterized protein with von Willebrand factor type A (vWA) domain
MPTDHIADERDKAQKQAARMASDEIRTGRDATLAVPKWDRYLAGSEVAEGGALADAVMMHKGPAWAGFCREVFSTLYESTEPKPLTDGEKPLGSEWVAQLHDTANNLPEWRALRARAARDPWACGVATGEALRVLGQQVTPPAEDPQQLQDELDLLRDLPEGGITSPQHMRRLASTQKRRDEAIKACGAATSMLGHKQASIRSALRAGVEKATKTIGEMEAAMAAFGAGAGDGSGMASKASIPPGEVRKAIMGNAKLRRIALLAGRMKSSAVFHQRNKPKLGHEEVCDVTAGDDLRRLLPSELGNLASEDTEALLFRRLMEKSALQYDLSARKKQISGPIILAIDESGSMGGQKDEWAKAVLFGILEIAARQNRAAYLIHFDSTVSRVDVFQNPKQINMKAIEEAVGFFSGGGTDIANALNAAADAMVKAEGPWKRADVILITDGIDGDEDGQAHAIARIKDRGGHLYVVSIESKATGVLHDEADEEVFISHQDIAKGDPSKLGTVFSI